MKASHVRIECIFLDYSQEWLKKYFYF